MNPLHRKFLSIFIGSTAFAAITCPLASAQMRDVKYTPVKIGMLVDSFQVERWQTDSDVFQKRVKELGAEVDVENADGDDELQLRQAQTLIDSGVNAIVLV